MANEQHLRILDQGADRWNAWRRSKSGLKPDLSEANLINRDLSRADLKDADLRGADLSKAQLSHALLQGASLESATLILADLLGATLTRADLKGASFFGAFLFATRLNTADLSGANLLGASLMGADLSFANLTGSHLMGANLHEAKLKGAKLSGADLTSASLVRTNIEGAIFEDCAIHGISTWDLEGQPQIQRNLAITAKGEAAVTVNDLELGQLIGLITSESGLSGSIRLLKLNTAMLMGRFRSKRREILDTIHKCLGRAGLAPVTLECEPSVSKHPAEKASLLSRSSRLLIVDWTDLAGTRGGLRQILDQCGDVPLLGVVSASENGPTFGDRTGTLLKYEDADHLGRLLDVALTRFAEDEPGGSEPSPTT